MLAILDRRLMEVLVAVFKLPLSGNIAQAMWTSFLSPFDSESNAISVNLGRSSAPEVEEEVLHEVGSYGKQLGRIGDAVAVLVKHFHPQGDLSAEERDALDALKVMLRDIADVKQQHERAVVRP